MGFTVERHGFLSRVSIINSLIKDFVNNGFLPIYFNTGLISDPVADITATKAILEAGPSVDPLSETQPYRVAIDGLITGANIQVGTFHQLLDDGSTYRFNGQIVAPGNTTVYTDLCGSIGHDGTDTGLVNDTYLSNASPYSYRLSITNRGFAFELFQELTINNVRNYSWGCVQRLVDPVTGICQTEGRAPVVALFSCNSGATAKQIIVRENDVLAPSQSEIVSGYSDYINQVINVGKQSVMSETNQYYVVFPAGFNTSRYLYNNEMDMVAYTSAGVISQYNSALMNVYGQTVISFSNGSEEPSIGDILSSITSGGKGTVYNVKVTSGTWEDGTAEGAIILSDKNGAFSSLDVIGNVTTSTIDIASIPFASQPLYRSYIGGCATIPDAEGMRMLYLISEGGI